VLRHARDVAVIAARSAELLALSHWLEESDRFCLSIPEAEVKSPSLQKASIRRHNATDT
jgi:hypothetical protein